MNVLDAPDLIDRLVDAIVEVAHDGGGDAAGGTWVLGNPDTFARAVVAALKREGGDE